MDSRDYAITFACYNQVEYTRLCIQSMMDSGVDLGRLVIVDNGSTDSTREYISSLDLGGCILNKSNLGCGVAWNQGALSLQAEWTIVMNNDVVVTGNWLDGLIGAAVENQLKIVSPAMVEGALDYDLEAFSRDASARMKDAVRVGSGHAVCLVVHESVWQQIGYFRPVPKLLGFEDTIFFDDVRKNAIPIGTTGASWLHHFGSVTQLEMKKEWGLKAREDLVKENLSKKVLHQNLLERKIRKLLRKRREMRWRKQELEQYGMSLLGVRRGGDFQW